VNCGWILHGPQGRGPGSRRAPARGYSAISLGQHKLPLRFGSGAPVAACRACFGCGTGRARAKLRVQISSKDHANLFATIDFQDQEILRV
jgi:hypothetical protein